MDKDKSARVNRGSHGKNMREESSSDQEMVSSEQNKDSESEENMDYEQSSDQGSEFKFKKERLRVGTKKPIVQPPPTINPNGRVTRAAAKYLGNH